MARDRDNKVTAPESVISIIGPGMTIVGNCETDGTVRVEGTVQGSIKAGKAVVVGKQGLVSGDINTQDAVVSGRVEGTLIAASRLELQASCHVEGEIYTRRMQLEEGAVLNGTVHMGEDPPKAVAPTKRDAQRPIKASEPRETPTVAPARP